MSKGDYNSKTLNYRLGGDEAILDKHDCCADKLVHNVYLYSVVDTEKDGTSWVRCNKSKRAGFLTCWYHDPLEEQAKLRIKDLEDSK